MDSLNRHEQLLRLFALIDILFGARQPLTTEEIKIRLRDRGVIDEMSDRNLRRDLEFLGNFGYPLERSKKRSDRGVLRQAWSIRPGRGAAKPQVPSVSLPELLSLAVAREFLAPLAGTLYWRGIAQLLAKLEQVATPELLDYVAAHKEGLVVHPRPPGGKYRSRTLNAINRAIRNALELEIRYTSLSETRPRRLKVRPDALVLYEGSIYIAARRATEEDGPLRFYKLDRVSDARPLSRPFTRSGPPVEELLADSITIFRSPEPPRRYRIRVRPPRARWACEKPFHPRQRVRKQADGGVILEIERAWDEELVPQLLALGDMVEVLEPADARDRILEEARRIAALYECRHVRDFDALRAGR
jgi:predicted DNA-binding transcriptional regulator YafY